MSKNETGSSSKTKGVGRKDRQMLKQKHRRQLQEAKLQQQRQEAKIQIQKLKQTGLVTAYEQYLRSICKNGLPQPANVYELAAQFILKFQKKHRIKMQKKAYRVQFTMTVLSSQKKVLQREQITVEDEND